MSAKSRSTRRQTATQTQPLPGDRITYKGMRGVVLSPTSNNALCLLIPNGRPIPRSGVMLPIPLPRPLYITGRQLKEFNAESIRLEFVRNLGGIEVIPDAMHIPVGTAFHYVSADPIPKQNIRLMFSLPRFIPKNWRQQMKKVVKSLTTVFLDITPDTFAVIQKQTGPRR